MYPFLVMKTHARDRKFDGTKTFSAEDCDFVNPIAALNNGVHHVTVSKRVAQEWLMYQQTVTFQDTVYWLQILQIGLGLCEVRRRARENKKTILVKKFEEI